MMNDLNREGWLTELAKQVEPIFKGLPIAAYRITCGWPCQNALSLRKRRIGECHGVQSSKGKVNELFISPTIDNPLEVAGVVCHELTHVVAGVEAAHKGKFVKLSKLIGLVKGKPTVAMPGERLNEKLEKIIKSLGKYPHQALLPVARTKTKSSSVTKLVCSCGCFVTISNKWLEEVGPPTCACGNQMGVV